MNEFNFGSRIAQLRKSRSLTQTDLADKLGVSQSALAMWEKDKREPDMETIAKIASFFNVSTDYILGQSDDPIALEPLSSPQSIRAWLRSDDDLSPEEKETLSDELEDYFKARKERLLKERASKRE